MRARHVVATAAVVAVVTVPAWLPAAGVTPPPMPAATPSGDWVPGWTPGATAPDGQTREPSGDRLPQTGTGPEALAVLAAAGLLAGGGWLAVRGWRR